MPKNNQTFVTNARTLINPVSGKNMFDIHQNIRMWCSYRTFYLKGHALKIGIFPGLYWLFQLESTILRSILRILAEKVRWVWFWRWEFSVKLEPCYVMLIPTLRRTLRLFFLGMVKTAFYSPGSRKTREHSIPHTTIPPTSSLLLLLAVVVLQ